MPLPLLIPLALGGLAAAGSAGLNNLPGMFKTKYDRYNEDELDKLLALKAQDQLGLTEREQLLRRQQYVDPGLNALAGQQVQLTTQGGGSALSGNDYARSLANRVALADLQGKIVNQGEQQVNAEDAAREQAQRAEIEQRSQYQSAAKRERQEAALGIPAAGLEGVASAYNFQQLVNAPPVSKTVAPVFEQLPSGMEEADLLRLFQDQPPEIQELLRRNLIDYGSTQYTTGVA